MHAPTATVSNKILNFPRDWLALEMTADRTAAALEYDGNAVENTAFILSGVNNPRVVKHLSCWSDSNNIHVKEFYELLRAYFPNNIYPLYAHNQYGHTLSFMDYVICTKKEFESQEEALRCLFRRGVTILDGLKRASADRAEEEETAKRAAQMVAKENELRNKTASDAAKANSRAISVVELISSSKKSHKAERQKTDGLSLHPSHPSGTSLPESPFSSIIPGADESLFTEVPRLDPIEPTKPKRAEECTENENSLLSPLSISCPAADETVDDLLKSCGQFGINPFQTATPSSFSASKENRASSNEAVVGNSAMADSRPRRTSNIATCNMATNCVATGDMVTNTRDRTAFSDIRSNDCTVKKIRDISQTYENNRDIINDLDKDVANANRETSASPYNSVQLNTRASGSQATAKTVAEPITEYFSIPHGCKQNINNPSTKPVIAEPAVPYQPEVIRVHPEKNKLTAAPVTFSRMDILSKDKLNEIYKQCSSQKHKYVEALRVLCHKHGVIPPEFEIVKENDVYRCTATFCGINFVSTYQYDKLNSKDCACEKVFEYIQKNIGAVFKYMNDARYQ